MKVNLKNLGILPNVEEKAEMYLTEIAKRVDNVREFLKQGIKGHVAGSDQDALEIARQDGTWSDYSDLELAKLDLGLNFNDYWFESNYEVTNEDIIEYVEESVDNI